ncbi:hypothetical protein POJ06DRAFT_69488 [Lipomyces tetrasporus]|uniref:Ketoreductase domain-containing protein n=1 Tax=Lipomyces tetrasporus TaxID=54092 RepID=A0AAD7QUF0_9ASCO|nr:uncharacterized protein POJ06DRAFT_69488 [Lipomyces tetrasporus]KAJ8101698.1 hypothetical protein POJ06DRAFT_69488 [Lipomyces tetrasporus]
MSSSSLAGKVAVITGGSKGIGRATALRLAEEGANVVINYSSDASAAEEVVKIIGADRSLAVKADAGNVAELERLVTETVSRFGKIDILVPNAGVMLMKDLETTTEHDFEASMALNVKGPYFLAQKAAPHMAPGSHIIFFSTTLCAASTVTPNYLLYVTTKGAVEQMTRVMSKDLARKGISVNAVAPGPTGTDLFFRGKSEQVLKMIAGFNPQNRIGTPEEIADVVAFLGGDGSRWVTGQTVRVNGGMA